MEAADKIYKSIGKFQSVVVPQGETLKMARKMPGVHFKIIETPVRQIHKRIAKHIEEKLALMDPVERLKKEKQLERNHELLKTGTKSSNLMTNAISTIEL